MTITDNLEISRSIQAYTFLMCCIACLGCPEVSLGWLFFLDFPVAYARKSLGSCEIDLKETHCGGILLSRFSPGCLSLALMVENQSCGTSLFHKQPILLTLVRKIWYPDLKEASSIPGVNSSPSFLAKFGISLCLPKCLQTSPGLGSQLC